MTCATSRLFIIFERINNNIFSPPFNEGQLDCTLGDNPKIIVSITIFK